MMRRALLTAIAAIPYCVLGLDYDSGGGGSVVPADVRESSIAGYSDPETVAISTFAWVKIPTSNLSSRMGYVVSVPSSLNANIVAHFGDCSSTSVATTVRPMEFLKGNGFTLVPADEDVCLWALSLHTTTESIHVQQVNQ